MLCVRTSKSRYPFVCTFAAGFIIAFGGGATASGKEKPLYAFRGGSDGASPYSTLIADSAGDLYGTTSFGGGGALCNDRGEGCGTVFELAADGTESVLYAFTGGSDGTFPMAGLVSDSAGNLYGTALRGGADNYGTVFMIGPTGAETTLYSFEDGSDGAYPSGSLLRDQSGSLYGMGGGGGTRGADCNSDGCGVVFEVPAGGSETVLYPFQGGTDGWNPVGSLIADSSGNLYGVTVLGGVNCPNSDIGCGTVFEIAPDGTETQLHVFQGVSDGAIPYAGLIADAAGNFYGTTGGGGSGTYGHGTIYEIAADGKEKVLYSFQGGSDGAVPESSLIMDSAGNLYGTTFYGGGTKCGGDGCGIVFKVTPKGHETVLFAFGRLGHGRNPVAGLLMGSRGLLYGTATAGGASNDGVVFSVKK